MKLLVIWLSCFSLLLLSGCNRTGRAGSEGGDPDTTQEGDQGGASEDEDSDDENEEDDQDSEDEDEDEESVPSHPELNSQLTPAGVENYNTLLAVTDTSRVAASQYTCTLAGNPTPLVVTLRTFSRAGRRASILCDILKDGDILLLYAQNEIRYCEGRLTAILAYLAGQGEWAGVRVEENQVMECHQDGGNSGEE